MWRHPRARRSGVLRRRACDRARRPSAQVPPPRRSRSARSPGSCSPPPARSGRPDLVLGRVVRVDPAKNAVTADHALGSRPFGLAYGAGSLWVSDRSAEPPRPDQSADEPRREADHDRLQLVRPRASAPAASGRRARRRNGAADQPDEEPRRREDQGGADAERRRRTPSARSGSPTSGEGRVVRIDPKTNKVTKRIAVAKADWITPSADALWVSTEAARSSGSIRERRGRRNDQRRREPARVGVGRRRALGAEHRRRNDLGDRSGPERGPDDVRGRPGPARRRRGSRGRVDLQLERRRDLAVPALAEAVDDRIRGSCIKAVGRVERDAGVSRPERVAPVGRGTCDLALARARRTGARDRASARRPCARRP